MAYYSNNRDYVKAQERSLIATEKKREIKRLVNNGVDDLAELSDLTGRSEGTIKNYVNGFGWKTRDGKVIKK